MPQQTAFDEFGRTPKINNTAGRDHWGNVFSVLMPRGGLRRGQVIGASTPRGSLWRLLPSRCLCRFPASPQG